MSKSDRPNSAGNRTGTNHPRDLSASIPVMRPSRLLAWYRVVCITVWTLWMILLNLRRAVFSLPMPYSVTMKWHRVVLRLTGVTATVTGEPVRNRPVLFVANHASYLDIVLLGSILPCSFVAKSEVRGWPVFGWLAVLQHTVFVKRDPRQAASQMQVMKDRLAEGGALVLFPEGTSSDGGGVLPFKSSLLQAATIAFPDTGEIEVQPVSIAYSRLDGMPIGRAFRSYYTWYGDMELAPHLIDWLGLGKLGVDLVFHPPLRLTDAGDRKILATQTQKACALGVEAALKGRPKAHSGGNP